MKLYYKPGACSLAPHILAQEANLPISLEKVDTKEGRTETGADFKAINPKGYVPTLQLEGGGVLTEAAVILQYLADQKPEAKLIPAAGTLARYRSQEWLNYIATELHKGMGPIFRATDEATRHAGAELLKPKFELLNAHLSKQAYLAGESFSAPDAYLFTVLNWTRRLKIDLSPWSGLTAFQSRVAERPAVRAALKAEGLLA